MYVCIFLREKHHIIISECVSSMPNMAEVYMEHMKAAFTTEVNSSSAARTVYMYCNTATLTIT